MRGQRRGAAAPREHLQVLPGKGRRFAHFRQAATFYIILGLVALLVIQAAYHWLSPHILSWRLQIKTVTMGVLEESVAVEGLVTRQELLLTAPASGVIIELAPPGERIPAGDAAAVIAPLSEEERLKLEKEAEAALNFWQKAKRFFPELLGGPESGEQTLLVTGEPPPWLTEVVSLDVPEAGLLLHKLDGWEGLEGSAYLSAEEYELDSRGSFEAKEGLWVEKGQPLVKLVDNWQWCYNLLLPLNPGRTLAAREEILVRFDFAPESPLSASLISAEIDSEKEEVRLTYHMGEQLSGFEDLRWMGAELVLESSEGVVVPEAAVIEHQGEPGVYVNLGGAVKFRPVDILGSLGEELVVEGIEPDSMVITRPVLVKEDLRLN